MRGTVQSSEYLLETIQADYVGQEIVPIYIGDDTTDEDAFRALMTHGGIGIIVRDTICRKDETDALYFLTDPLEVSQSSRRTAVGDSSASEDSFIT